MSTVPHSSVFKDTVFHSYCLALYKIFVVQSIILFSNSSGRSSRGHTPPLAPHSSFPTLWQASSAHSRNSSAHSRSSKSAELNSSTGMNRMIEASVSGAENIWRSWSRNWLFRLPLHVSVLVVLSAHFMFF